MIFIAGAARSGTSLTTEILQGLGCYLGRPCDINSLFENIAIREGFVKQILGNEGFDPMGQDPLPPANWTCDIPMGALAELGRMVELILSGGANPAFKDAKLSLVWPAFHRAFPFAKWVIVRRDREEVIDSCMRTHFMRKRFTRESWGEWVDHHDVQFARMRAAGLKLIEVWPRDFMADPERFRPVAEFCGVPFKSAIVSDAVDPLRFKRIAADEHPIH